MFLYLDGLLLYGVFDDLFLGLLGWLYVFLAYILLVYVLVRISFGLFCMLLLFDFLSLF